MTTQTFKLPFDAIGQPYIDNGNWLITSVDRMSCDRQAVEILPGMQQHKIVAYDKENKTVTIESSSHE